MILIFYIDWNDDWQADVLRNVVSNDTSNEALLKALISQADFRGIEMNILCMGSVGEVKDYVSNILQFVGHKPEIAIVQVTRLQTM